MNKFALLPVLPVFDAAAYEWLTAGRELCG